jgi:hypothetical protein
MISEATTFVSWLFFNKEKLYIHLIYCKPKNHFMKKILLLIICITLISATTNAQYRINKTKYDSHNYVIQAGDPYNPAASGICSFLIPGLGQMISGEGGRGVGFLLGCMGSFGVFITGGLVINTTESDPDFTQKQATGSILILAGLTGSTVFWLW